MAAPSTVLIVDDEPGGRALLQTLLKSEPYRLVLASSGATALQAAEKEHPDVVLLDVMMPDMNGFAVCQKMRQNPALAEVPIILLTALDDRSSRLRGLEAGADDFLSKPYDPAELKTRLKTITRLNRFRRLGEEKARYERLVELAPVGIVVLDAKSRIVESNAAFRQLVGADPKQREFLSLLPAERREAFLARLASRGSGNPPPFETTLAEAARPETVVDITAGPVARESDGHWLLIVRDISEKKALEQQLLRSQRIELLGQLAGGIVHDVNNLQAAALVAADLLEMEVPAAFKSRFDPIRTSIRRSSALLRQLLAFARGYDGERKPLSPAVILAEVAAVARDTFGASIHVSVDAPAHLGEIVADSNQVHQVLMNLCVNARDAMASGGKLVLRAKRRQVEPAETANLAPDAVPGQFVVLSVSDTGAGIPVEIRPRLFEPFFTTKPHGKGTGLGLATVHRLVKRHGGYIVLESAIGKGTSFHCYFPAALNLSAIPADAPACLTP